MHRFTVLAQTITTYGVAAQTDMMLYEMAELAKALLKLRGLDDVDRAGAMGSAAVANIREEIADVQIMLDQMRMVYGDTTDFEEAKIQRMSDRLTERSR